MISSRTPRPRLRFCFDTVLQTVGMVASSSKKRSSLFVYFFHYLFVSVNTNSSATGLEGPKPTVKCGAAVVKTQYFPFTDDKHPQEMTYLMIHWPRGTCKAEPPFPFFRKVRLASC